MWDGNVGTRWRLLTVMRWRLVYFIAKWEDNTICRGLIHNMFKIPKFRDFDWVFRYFNSVFQNEVKACIFHRQAGGSHKYEVHTSYRIGYFVCKIPLWGVDTTFCINGQTYLEALWGWVCNNTCNLEMSGTLVLAATSVMMISIIIIIISRSILGNNWCNAVSGRLPAAVSSFLGQWWGWSKCFENWED